jgi:hypothetical protein
MSEIETEIHHQRKGNEGKQEEQEEDAASKPP